MSVRVQISAEGEICYLYSICEDIFPLSKIAKVDQLTHAF